MMSHAAVVRWCTGFHPFPPGHPYPLSSSCICPLCGPDGEGDVSVLGERVTCGPVNTQPSLPWVRTSCHRLLACIATCPSRGLPINSCPRTPPHPPPPSIDAFELVWSVHDRGWLNSLVTLGCRECISPTSGIFLFLFLLSFLTAL